VQQTANLMDYAGGTDLWKYQWDLIHNPESIVFAWAQDEEEGEYYDATFADLWSQNINNIACAKKNNQTQVELKEIIPGLSGSFEYGSIGKIKLEIPELAASMSDNAINLTSQEVSDYTDYRDGKQYVQVVYKSVSGKYRVFFKIAPEKKNDFLSIVNNPSSTFFTGLCKNIPEEESNEAYSKLAQLPVCSYEEIGIANRIKYFEWLSGEKWTNEDQEIILLDLLTHVKDRKELYNELYKRPVLLAKMMLSCDGDNRQKFINEITKLCDESWTNGITAKGDVYIGTVPGSFGTFYSGNDFITYAVLSESSNNCSVRNYIGRFPKGMFDLGNVQMLRELGDFSCNLLDPVEIISSDGSQGMFPLIYPVNLSQQHGNQQVGQQFAATLNYIGVASSVRILATGSKLAKSIAFVELTKTGLDAIFNDPQVIETLGKTEDGKKFLKYWQIASVTIDIATIGADVLENIAKHGPEASKALRAAGKNDAADNVDDLVAEATIIKAGNSTYLSNLQRYKQLFKEGKISELFTELKKTTAFPKMGNTRIRNQVDLLAEYKAKYGQNASNFPYSTSNPVTDFELAETGYFVRVYSGNSTNSSWIFRIEDLRQYKNVDEIVEKLALPSKPTKVGLVELPEGVKLRKSEAGPQNNGTTPQGGGIQYEIIGDRNNEWFKPLFDNIDDFFK
jgi:hypothetical protein